MTGLANRGLLTARLTMQHLICAQESATTLTSYYSSVRRWEKGGSIPLPRNLPAHASDATVPLVYAEHDSL